MFPYLSDNRYVNVVATYWTDIDLRTKGVARYAVITHSHTTLSSWLNLTNELIKKKTNEEFKASWLLVTRWSDVCPYPNQNCSEVILNQPCSKIYNS